VKVSTGLNWSLIVPHGRLVEVRTESYICLRINPFLYIIFKIDVHIALSHNKHFISPINTCYMFWSYWPSSGILLPLAWCYNSGRVLAFSTVPFHLRQSWTYVHFMSFIFFRSFLTLSSHRDLGLPTGLPVNGYHLCIFFTILYTFQNTNLVHNSFNLQQYICYTTLLNMFRAACCSKHVEECSVTYILLKIKRIVH